MCSPLAPLHRSPLRRVMTAALACIGRDTPTPYAYLLVDALSRRPGNKLQMIEFNLHKQGELLSFELKL